MLPVRFHASGCDIRVAIPISSHPGTHLDDLLQQLHKNFHEEAGDTAGHAKARKRGQAAISKPKN